MGELGEEYLDLDVSIENSFCRTTKPDVPEFTVIDTIKFNIQPATESLYFHFIKTIFIMIAPSLITFELPC